jgi:hypothetical protein
MKRGCFIMKRGSSSPVNTSTVSWMKRGRFIRGRGGRHLISSLIHVSSTLRRTCLYSSLWYESLGLIACLIFCFIILHFSVVAPHHLQIMHRPHKALLREVCCIVSSQEICQTVNQCWYPTPFVVYRVIRGRSFGINLTVCIWDVYQRSTSE